VDGNGVTNPTISFAPPQLSFGPVAVGSKKDLVLTINNTGTMKLNVTSITSDNADFSALIPQFEVPGGGSFTDTIRFMPSVLGARSGFLNIVSSASTSPDSVYVEGTGTEVQSVRQLQSLPGAFTVYQNYPNPFSASNGSSTIRYDLEVPAPVRVTVLNILGQIATTLVDETQDPGIHTVRWTPNGNTPGVYFYEVRIGNDEVYGTMVFLK